MAETPTEAENQRQDEAKPKLTLGKSKSRIGGPAGRKSMANLANRRGKSMVRLNEQPTRIEPIVLKDPAAALVRLKDDYYRSLRSLVPPLPQDKPSPRCIVDRKLREMHDAIDEIDRKLDEVNLAVFGVGPCHDDPTRPLSTAAPTAFGVRLSKPITDVEAARPYRVRVRPETFTQD